MNTENTRGRGDHTDAAAVRSQDAALHASQLRHRECALSKARYEHVEEVGRSRARHHGLTGEDVEDCALEFVEHLHQRSPTLPEGYVEQASEQWLIECADNWIRDFLRRRNRVRKKEHSLLEAEMVLTAEETPLYAGLLTSELNALFYRAISSLTRWQQYLAEQHFVLDRKVAEIVQATGRTPNAVSWGIWNLRRRLPTLLARNGLDEAEAHDYLRELQAHSIARSRQCRSDE